jgi:sec-independent protein translocase protein TatA
MGRLFDSPTLLIILIVAVVLLFGSKRLPDAARGVGRSLRILKAETKGLMTDEEENAQKAPQVVQQAPAAQQVAPQQAAQPAPQPVQQPAPQPVQQPVAEQPPAAPPVTPQPAAPEQPQG